MNRKSVYSLVLAVALAVSFAFPVFADDLATASNSNYFSNSLLNYNSPVLLVNEEPIQLSVNHSTSQKYIDYDITSTINDACYLTIGSGVTASTIQIFNYIGGTFEPRCEYSPDFFFDDGGFWQSSTSMLHTNYVIPVYVPAGGKLKVRVYYTGTALGIFGEIHYPRYKMDTFSGLYTADDKKISKGIDFRYFSPSFDFVSLYQTVLFPSTPQCTVVGVQPVNSNAVYKAGFQYTVRMKHSFHPTGIYVSGVIVEDTPVKEVGEKYSYLTFTPRFDTPADDVYFALNCNINARGQFVGIDDITSTYIPVSDTGQQGQTTAANTTIIKNVVTNISNTVSNISNQITTSTTTITNAVNNVANQVTGSINSQTNTLSDKIQGQTNTITNNQNQNTDKVIRNQDENTDKVVKNQDENTDKLTKNQDENTDKVTEKLEDVKTGIISGIIEGLKNLFIPSEDFFKSYFDDLYSWFGERLGFLSFPIDLLAELAEMFLGSSSTDCILTLPSFSISGFKLWEESSFNLTSFLNENFKFVLDAIKLGTSVILVFNFIHLCERKWEEVMMN